MKVIIRLDIPEDFGKSLQHYKETAKTQSKGDAVVFLTEALKAIVFSVIEHHDARKVKGKKK